MDVTIRGRNVEIPPGVRQAASEKVARLARFPGGFENADVQLSQERNPRIAERELCEVTLRGPGRLLRARAAAAEAGAAVELAVEKLEHQLEKAKPRRPRRPHAPSNGPASLNGDSLNGDSLNGDSSNGDGLDGYALDGYGGADSYGGAGGDGGPVAIVRTKPLSSKPMTPEEAVMQMEMAGQQFCFFTNADTEEAAVVYRRGDGRIGIIEAR